MQESGQDFSPQFVAMLAAGVYETKEVLATFGVSQEQFKALQDNVIFREMLVRFTMEYQQKGLNAQLKAGFAVEMLIPGMHKIANDVDVNPEIRKQVFDSLVKLANLSKDAVAPQGPQVSALQIIVNNIAPAAQRVIDAPRQAIEIRPSESPGG